MWPWIRHWRDWAIRDLWPLSRVGPRARTLHYSYEKAGLTVANQPVPWSAEAVLVEAILRLPARSGRRKSDFQLRLPRHAPLAVDAFRRTDQEDHFRLLFRLPPLTTTTPVELLFREHLLGHLTIPFLSREEFLAGLRLQMPTISVRLGSESVACQTFVSTQCRGLLASAVIASPTALVPLLDEGLEVEFRCERSGNAFRLPLCLSSSQVAGRSALIHAVPRRYPRKMGTWVVTWFVADRPLASQRIQGISQRQFRRSLRITGTRFVVQDDKGGMRLVCNVPVPGSAARVGPCFFLSSSEPGMAGLCPLRITAQVAGAVQPPLLQEQQVLISDGPSMVALGTLDQADLAQVNGFELAVGKRVLGNLPMSPAPMAVFTSEGGFRALGDYTWTPAAEEDMNQRLQRLLDLPQQGE